MTENISNPFVMQIHLLFLTMLTILPCYPTVVMYEIQVLCLPSTISALPPWLTALRTSGDIVFKIQFHAIK